MGAQTLSSVLIALPAHNEDRIVGSVIASLHKIGYSRILVVDDGSTDKTAYVARKARSRVITFSQNRGKGSALRAAIAYTIKNRYQTLVTMDADGQHDPHDISALLSKRKKYDVVLGNRFAKHNPGIPAYARFANVAGNIITFLFTGMWVHDSQCGLRAYATSALQKMSLRATHYEIDTEIIRELKRNSISYTQVPVRVRYTAYSKSKRTKQSFAMGLETLLRLVRLYR